MNYKLNIIIFLIIFIIQVRYDHILHQCQNSYGKNIIIFHHFINIYMIVGSVLFGNYLLHLVLIIIAFITHKINGKCFITKYTNEICFKEDNNYPLITITTHLTGIYEQKKVNNSYYMVLILIILYDLYYINKEYKIIEL